MDEKYRTSDLYFAAYLKVAGVPLISTEKEGKKVFFLFERTPFLTDLKNEYFNRTARVPALTFVDEIRSMKALTHMVKED